MLSKVSTTSHCWIWLSSDLKNWLPCWILFFETLKLFQTQLWAAYLCCICCKLVFMSCEVVIMMAGAFKSLWFELYWFVLYLLHIKMQHKTIISTNLLATTGAASIKSALFDAPYSEIWAQRKSFKNVNIFKENQELPICIYYFVFMSIQLSNMNATQNTLCSPNSKAASHNCFVEWQSQNAMGQAW